MRQCPTPEGDGRPLIAHVIEPCSCLARQRELYHKCHRCIYRGKSAEWVAAPGVAGQRVVAVESAPLEVLARQNGHHVGASAGHAGNGHAGNGHAANGHAGHGHAGNGHSGNGHAAPAAAKLEAADHDARRHAPNRLGPAGGDRLDASGVRQAVAVRSAVDS